MDCLSLLKILLLSGIAHSNLKFRELFTCFSICGLTTPFLSYLFRLSKLGLSGKFKHWHGKSCFPLL